MQGGLAVKLILCLALAASGAPEPGATLKNAGGVTFALGAATALTRLVLLELSLGQGQQLQSDIAAYNADPKRTTDAHDKLLSRTTALASTNIVSLVAGRV